MNVAQYKYHDEWVNTENGGLRAWYVCLQDWGGTCAPCGTVMPSKQWTPRFACVCCGTKYRINYGMLVEVHTKWASTFRLADGFPGDVEDIRAMFLEKKLAPMDFGPMDPQVVLRPLEPGETDEGDVDPGTISQVFKVQGLKDIPKWEWCQIWALLGQAAQRTLW